MSMRRNSITVNESGNIIMPENVSNIWMSEPELVELFGVLLRHFVLPSETSITVEH